jgi:hypothetical protein
MSTLVLLIPYDNGLILISDRQSTKYDQTKEAWDKIYKINESLVIGFAGNSEQTRFLAQLLESYTEPISQSYVSAYRRLQDLDRVPRDMEIDALCISKIPDGLQPYRITRNLCFRVNEEAIGIGEGEPMVRPQLADCHTKEVSLEQAIGFGKTLIQYASFCVGSVGPPSQFGFSLATVPTDGNVKVETVQPEMVSIERLRYRFED